MVLSKIVSPRNHLNEDVDGGSENDVSVLTTGVMAAAPAAQTPFVGEPLETTPLLSNGFASDQARGFAGDDRSERGERLTWTVESKPTWREEAEILTTSSLPLIVTFVLQYSLTAASIFIVGHLGKTELGAMTLANLSANISGYAIYQGLAMSLDTLCPQAYGTGNKQLVGLQLQRMVYFLWCITIPIALLWFNMTAILRQIIPQPEIADLAGYFMRILILGAPGYAAFESGKRFTQAQGLFKASFWVLLICAPLNVFLGWLFVHKLQWGSVGAPIAIVITQNLMPALLGLYVVLIAGRECWNGLTTAAFRNWGPMIRLALPSLTMLEAEFLAFEILSIASSYFSATHLAAQSVLATITTIAFMFHFAVSIAASTRIAHLIGAACVDKARMAAKVAFVVACGMGVFNAVLLGSLRHYIPLLFTGDSGVIVMVSGVLPLCAFSQLFDVIVSYCNGVLRGLGRQKIGGWAALCGYYIIAMPVAMGTGFGLGWELYGYAFGMIVAMAFIGAVEGWFISRTSWEQAVSEVKRRHALQ